MIVYRPHWRIIQMEEQYYVCRRDGGVMIPGPTIELAKQAYKEFRKKDMDLDYEEI